MFYWSRPGSELLFLLPVTLWLLAVREMNPSVPFYINCPPYSLIFHQGLSTTELYQYILYITSSSTLSPTPFFFFRVMAAKGSRVIVLVIHEPSLLSLVGNYGFKMCVVIVQSQFSPLSLLLFPPIKNFGCKVEEPSYRYTSVYIIQVYISIHQKTLYKYTSVNITQFTSQEYTSTSARSLPLSLFYRTQRSKSVPVEAERLRVELAY